MMLRALVLLLLLATPASAHTVADFLEAMQTRVFPDREANREFLAILGASRSPFPDIARSVDRDQACRGFLARDLADPDALAFAHLHCATGSLEAAIALSPAAAALVHVRRAERAMRRDRDRALQHFELAVAANPRDPYPYYRRALVFEQWKETDAALGDLQRVVAIAPGHWRAYLLRARICLARGEVEGAIADSIKAMQRAGRTFIQATQSALKKEGLYAGAEDGVDRPPLRRALQACLRDPSCQLLRHWTVLAESAS